jgi:hypothetical protein
MEYNTIQFIKDILSELSIRNIDGIPNLKREDDLRHLYNILAEYGVSHFDVNSFIQRINEAGEIELTDKARKTIDSQRLTHMGYGYWGKNDEVMFKKNDKGELVATTDDEYKDDVEKKQKDAGNVDGKTTPKKVNTPKPNSDSEEAETPPPSAFTGDALKSLQADLPDNDPAKPTADRKTNVVDDSQNDDNNVQDLPDKPQPNKLTDSDDPDSDGEIKQKALEYGTKNPREFKPAPGNISSMTAEILSGEAYHHLDQNPDMTDEELAEALYNQIAETPLGRQMGSGNVKKKGKYKDKNQKLYELMLSISRSGKTKYNRTQDGINNLKKDDKLSDPIKTRNYYGHGVSKKKQMELIEKLPGPFYTRLGVEIPKEELLNLIKNSGGGDNPSDTATISVDSQGRALIEFHSDKISLADIQANSTTKKETEKAKQIIQGSNLSDDEKEEAIRILEDGQTKLDNKESELKTAANGSARNLAKGDIQKILSDIKSDRGISGGDKVSTKLESIYKNGNPHPSLIKYLPKQDEPYTEEQALKAFYEYAGDDNRTGELTEDHVKLLYRSAKQQGYDISSELGKIRQESIDIQRETHSKLNQRTINLPNGESKPLGDYIEAKNIVDKLHIGVIDGDRGHGVSKYPGLFNVNMGGTIVEDTQIKGCLGVGDTDDFIESFEVGTPDEQDSLIRNTKTGQITGRNVFVYAVTKSGQRIKVAYKTQRSKQGESGKLETTYQWDKETQDCFKKNQ